MPILNRKDEALLRFAHEAFHPTRPKRLYENVPVASLDNEEFDLENLLPIQQASMMNFDVEQFIYGLPYRNVAVLVFLSMGYKAKEIKRFMRLKDVNSVHHIVGDLRRRHMSADL